MIIQHIGRRQRRHNARILAASFAQLNFPWLAPAQARWLASQAAGPSRASQEPRGRRPSGAKSRAQSRQLATAAEEYGQRYMGQYPPPGYTTSFRKQVGDGSPAWSQSPTEQTSLSSLRPYEDPVIINTSIRDPYKTTKVTHGIHGTGVDLLHHLHTAIQVGRLPRAEAIIHRIGDICSSGSIELIHAHTAYLEGMLKLVAMHGRGEQAKQKLADLQKWFELEIRGTDVPISAKMLVVLIRASIRALSGSQRDRTVRRYTDIARRLGDDTYYDVLESEDYDDNEFTILGSLTFGDRSSENLVEEPRESERLSSPREQREQREPVLDTENLPEVMPTEQRGLGLKSVKETLQSVKNNPKPTHDMSLAEQKAQDKERQSMLEKAAVEVAVERWRQADEELRRIGINTSMQSKHITALMWQWYQSLLPALEAELAEYQKIAEATVTRRDNPLYHYGPYLELLPLEKVAASTIMYVMTAIASRQSWKDKAHSGEVKMAALTVGLFKTLEEDCKADQTMKRQNRGRSRDFSTPNDPSSQRQLQSQNGRKKQSKLERLEKLEKLEKRKQAILARVEWPRDHGVKLSAMLISKLMGSAELPVTRKHPRTREDITQMQPAFLHRWKYTQGKKIGVFSANPELVKKVESEPFGGVIAKRMPMVVEPTPWSGWNTGAYLHYPNPVLRLPSGDNSGKDYFLAAHERGDMDQIYAGLTALGAVPWKIHHGVFKVQLDAWNSGEAIANLAPLQPDIALPPDPGPNAEPDIRMKWSSEMRHLQNKRAGIHSKRCFQNFQFEVAHTMINETLYFPHNMDFRGRAYPIPPYLNHMGADNVRGLLVFAEGKELGPNGLRWLKIHLATVAGHDKASMAERIAFTESHLDEIYDSVRKPLDGKRWWLESEDAWQTLAACFELTDALDSPDPTKFVSHLPIQQDGTCNGLQHYAALGGDKVGAAQVNLEPGDRPADVYTAVAEAVKEEVRKDAAKGNAVAQKLDGRLTRKCVKQPVMTNVYGVTWFGAKVQVEKQLEILFPEVHKHDKVNLSEMSMYVANKIFSSLGSMFSGAQAIQTWLGECANMISTCLTPEQVAEIVAGKPIPQYPKIQTLTVTEEAKYISGKRSNEDKTYLQSSNGTAETEKAVHRSAKPLFRSAVVWTTPLRLPVVQPYRSSGRLEVQTPLQNILLMNPQVWHPVSRRKQLQAFPPNFIHSLDATHMLLSALKCKDVGVTFASIHDSFWTHACDVNTLSRVLRDSFIEMHKDNIIGRLREEFQTRYEGCMYMATVVAKSAVGLKIIEWRSKRNIKKGAQSELAIEAERRRLLHSQDPDERAQGEAMTTPASIMANEADASAFVVPKEITNQQLGKIPANATENTAREAEDDNDESLDDDSDDAIASGVDVAQDDAELPAEADVEVPADIDASESPTKYQRRPKKDYKYERKLYVWMPLVFPEVPPRGEFDVRKIRESDYFFH